MNLKPTRSCPHCVDDHEGHANVPVEVGALCCEVPTLTVVRLQRHIAMATVLYQLIGSGPIT